eukprot:310727_1
MDFRICVVLSRTRQRYNSCHQCLYISRYIAFSKDVHLMNEADVFQRKLMKSILLAQFWPMPLACTIHAIEDCLQEEDIICAHDDKKSWNHDGMSRKENK